MLTGIGFTAVLAWFFYRSLIAFLFLLPLVEVYRKLKRKERRRQMFEQMERQFMDALASLAGALKAGYSVDHALTEAWREMVLLYGENALISREFGRMQSRLEMNRRPEEVLMEFAQRSRLEDAAVFAEVFAVAGRSGGDLILVISKTTEMIGEKLRAEQEIRTAIRARQFEQKIMNGMPLGILAYMEVVSPGYMAPMYGTIRGIFIMSLGLLLYGAAYLLGKKMTEIEV
ncbi:MAG: type II secretion system protein F [Lachnospiraceae bacterium]|nr:type II secretion system protein F [Lachnospiraceae bacterium]